MKRILAALLSFLGMLILILDSKTMVQGATEGISLCMKTVIPALFPFLILSALLTPSLLGSRISHPGLLTRVMKLPQGCSSIWLVGMLGGYPTGARSIAQAVKDRQLSPQDGSRMLCFCNNAGPSFLFGIGMVIFEDFKICLLIWLIHILSSIVIGILTPGTPSKVSQISKPDIPSIPAVMQQSITTMSLICGWVVLFRILTSFLEKWLFGKACREWLPLVQGLLELTNGCCNLSEEKSMAVRFIFFNGILSFGGLCVAMQTYSITASADIDFSLYMLAKLAQGAVSMILAFILSSLLFPHHTLPRSFLIAACAIVIIAYKLVAAITKKDWKNTRRSCIMSPVYIRGD